MELKGSLPCSQKSAVGPVPKSCSSTCPIAVRFISLSFHLRLCLYVLKFFIKNVVYISLLSHVLIFCPSYFCKSIQIKFLYVTGSLSLGWQKVWARSHGQTKWWVLRYQMKKKTACWPRERAAMNMIDCRPQMYTWFFLHRLRRCFKSSTMCVEHLPITFHQDCSLLKWTQHFNFYLHCFKKPSATWHSVC